jgi:hypothetical protein
MTNLLLLDINLRNNMLESKGVQFLEYGLERCNKLEKLMLNLSNNNLEF